MKNRTLLCILFLLTGTSYILGMPSGIDINDTKMLSQPAISESQIAFVYAGDLWIADQTGETPRRLTSDEGIESNPFFSPDGQWIAFSAQYDGNTDVFVVPAAGGIPKRLTWHPGSDYVRGFTPDGKSILFTSSRHDYSGRYTQLFTIPVEGGFPVRLKIPNAHKASFSADGTRMAYTPLGEVFHQWKNYRGGSVATIWLIRFSDLSAEKIPQPDGRCNDTDPMWIGDRIFFRSDRNGEFNIFSYDLASKTIRQLTTHEDFPVLNVSAGKERIIYEQAGHLHILDLSNNQSQKLQIGVASDLLELRPRYVKGSRYIRNAGISPSGARTVFEFRGEIITVPEKEGDPRNLTQTVNAHERSPLWSPDGKTVAYFSDESGEYELYLKAQDGEGIPKKFKLNGTGFYTIGYWSPDSKKITFSDNGRNLYWINIETGKITRIGNDYFISPGAFGNMFGTWSPDSKWIAYTTNNKAYFQQVFLYSLEQNKSFPLSDGLSDVSNPVIDPGGKYIYFFSSTDAGPVKHWFDQSTADMRMTRNIYLATLRKDIQSPLFKESNEEEPEEENSKDVEENDKTDKKSKDKGDAKTGEAPFTIDFDGINERIIDLPVQSGNYYNLQVGDEGKIYFIEAPPTRQGPYGSDTKLNMYDLKERKMETILTGVNNYFISNDHKKILYTLSNSWGIISSTGTHKSGEGKIDTESIEVRIDPPAEWQQIFDEAWRINRDYFYDPGMHGADWDAMKEKYAVFLPHLSCRNDLNRVIQWMCSELSVGHHRVGGGDYLQTPDRVGGGLLGADFAIENGRYRIKKIYGGLNWNPEMRSPLTEPGVNVEVGEYLLAVNGKELTGSINLYSLFENTSGKIVELTVGPNPGFTGSRKTEVVPVSGEWSLRNRDWVEGNLKKVDEATGGKVAYVYVPNTAGSGHTYFKRYFFPQSHKDAIIIDERFNGGGLLADYYIDILNRQYQSYWNMRYGADLKTPSASIQGPKVMLIDETAGSGGDMLPWMFRKFNMGPLIGKRTWGGLVGTLGFPILMDGGYVTAPNLGIWTEDGFVVENTGVPPDIEVEQLPAEVINGHDPQLEKAIEVILEELEKNPPHKPVRPPYPVRVRK